MYSICTFFSHIASGVNSGAYKNIEEALKAAHSAGITTVDCSSVDLTAYPNMADLLKKADITVASVHASLKVDYSSKEAFYASVDAYKEAIDNACAVASPCFMIVPHPAVEVTEEEYPHFAQAVRDLVPLLCEYAKEKGITPTMENFSLRHFPYSTFEQLDVLLSENPDLCFTYDSGNFVLVGLNEVEAAARYASRTVHVHFKDLKKVEHGPLLRDGIYYDSLELGGGYLENLQALKLLRSGGYQSGALTIEVSGPDAFGRVLKSAEWLKQGLAAFTE